MIMNSVIPLFQRFDCEHLCLIFLPTAIYLILLSFDRLIAHVYTRLNNVKSGFLTLSFGFDS